MTELSGYTFETLWDDSELVLSRAVRDGEGTSRLLLAPVSVQPSPECVARLERAFALRGDLDAAWATLPLGLERHSGRPALLLEDPGGEPLARLMGQPWEITSFLRLPSAWRPRSAGSTSGASSTRTSSRPTSSSNAANRRRSG